MSTIDEEKKDLREQVLSGRNEIPEGEWQEKSLSIIRQLTESNFFSTANVVHTYVSMNERREVNTDELIEKLFESEKKVIVPVTDFSDHSLTHIELRSFGELISNKWGVREPENKEKEVQPEDLDIIIIPMAAADRKGNRLGYGQGFYDRFLKETNGLKVGFIFSEFLFDEIPAEGFDVKMDIIITENELIFT